MDLVSVIIPTYNRGYCLKRTIESVLAQTYKNLELIIIDDHSDDNTKQVVDGIGDERLKYFYLNENVGPSKARNIGVGLAQGGYVALQDSDDIWDVRKLEKQMKVFAEDVDFVFCDFDYMQYGLRRTIFNGEDVERIIRIDPLSILARRNVIGAPTMVIRKDLYTKVGGFDETLRSFEDWEFVVRIAKKTRFVCVNECLVHVERHLNSVNDSQINAIEQIRTFLKICEKSSAYAWQSEETWEVRMNVLSMLLSYLDTEQRQAAEVEFCLAMEMDQRLFAKYNEKWHEANRFHYRVTMLEKLSEKRVCAHIKSELEKRHYHRIAIYGIGWVGRVLIDKMLSIGVKAEYIIDKMPQEYEGIQSYRPEEIPGDIDMIIMTVFDYGKIARYVEGVAGVPVVPLSELIPW